jgi:guanine deaminase
VDEISFFLKGDVCWNSSPGTLETAENSLLLCSNGKSGGVFKNAPKEYINLPVKDYTGSLIMPGLTDLHIHAPQFAYMALGMDMELLEWLNKITFPEEAKYRDPEYAREAYGRFIDNIKKGPGTRLCVFATIHVPSTLLLMDLLEESGLISYTGKVSMDRNCPEYLKEDNALSETSGWLDAYFKRQNEGQYKNTAPIISPRFIPSCTGGLLNGLSMIQRKNGLPLQSHLSENRKEVEWVKELCPESENYAAAYADAGLLEGPAIMAHCVWSGEREMEILEGKGVYIAHCPQSNMNLSSGIAPVRRFLERGIPLGLGSDVAGGAGTSIFRAMTDAIQVSKLRQALIAPEEKALTLEEAFYMGTAGGGAFFGKLDRSHVNPMEQKTVGFEFGPAGSFEPGWDFDALVIDDSSLRCPSAQSIRGRLERVVYLSDNRQIAAKYVRGKKLI